MPEPSRHFSDFDYDVFLIGAGQANVPLGPKLAKDGFAVALAEREHMGGSCVNFGCMPSKAIHASARVAHQARNARDFGIDIDPVAVRPDLGDVLARARVFTEKARHHIFKSFESNGVCLLEGHARLAGRHGEGFRVEIALSDGGTESVTARRVVLDPGSRTNRIDLPGLDLLSAITSETWIDRDDVPARLLILGGGYIGCEMAQTYRRLGRDVTLVQNADQLLTREDPEIAGWLQRCFEDEGIVVRVGASAQQIERVGDGFRLHLKEGQPVDFDGLFLATGRLPNTDDLGLDTVGVETDKKRAIATDEYGAVDGCPGLYAVGDCRGGPAFTHTAHDDHHILRGRLLDERDPGGSPDRQHRLVPYAVFTDPEIGRVGLSECQAKEKGIDPQIVCVDMRSNDRARTVGESHGMVKLVLDPNDPDGKLLGATVIGTHAGELIHAFVMLMHLEKPLASILDIVFIHPTLFEIVHQAVDRWHKSRN